MLQKRAINIKILCVDSRTADISSSKIQFTGGENRFHQLAKRWTAAGNEVYTIGTTYTKYLSNFFGSNMKVCVYKPLEGSPNTVFEFLNIKRMAETAPNEHFDVIYCPYELIACLSAGHLLKQKLKAPLACSVNLLEEKELKTFPFFLQYRRCLLKFLLTRSVDLIFSVSSHPKNLLIKAGVDQRRIHTVVTGFNSKTINSVEPQQKIYDACYLGDIIPRKGLLDLVIAWKTIVDKNPNAKLVVIGRRVDEDYCRKIDTTIEKLNIQANIVMTGRVPEMEKIKLMKSSRIFVFPSYWEAMAGVMVEAMACELPVIAYDLPMYFESYGEDVVYVPKGNIKSLAKAIGNLLDNETLQENLKYRGAKRVKQFDWDKIAAYQITTMAKTLL